MMKTKIKLQLIYVIMVLELIYTLLLVIEWEINIKYMFILIMEKQDL